MIRRTASPLHLCFLFTLGLLCTAHPSVAAELTAAPKHSHTTTAFDAITGKATPVSHAPQHVMQRLSDYLNGLQTLRAEFTQTNEENKRESGTFFLKRPSQARWEYHPPSPLTLIANSGFLSIIDTELEEVRNIPAENALSSVLSAKHIDLSNVPGVITSSPERSGDYIHISLRKKNAGHDGSLTLRFKETDNGVITLAGFTQLDAAGRTTDITFTELYPNVEVHKSQFDVPTFRSGPRR